MVDIRISGRRVTVTDAMRERVQSKISEALKVFDIKPMSCDVVLRVDKNRSNPDRRACEVTVHVRDYVVRVVSESDDMYAAIDDAADKLTRQMRKFKTRVVDRRQRAAAEKVSAPSIDDLANLIDPPAFGDDDDQLVREKYVELTPMTEEEALVQTDLLGHDFYVFQNKETGLVNVIYHRKNGGYGIIKPKIASKDGEA